MKKVILALVVGALASTSALAWGPRDQGILTGVAGLWVVQQLARPNAVINVNGNPVYINQQPVYVQPAPVYMQPAPVYVSPPVYVQQPQQWCESVPVIDQFGGHRSVQYCYYK